MNQDKKECQPDITSEEITAKIHTNNVCSASFAITNILRDTADTQTILQAVEKLADDVIHGNDTKVKGALITQSKVLGVIFNRFASNAANAQTIDSMKAYMDVALRAQNQCRKTLLALHAIQHPQQQQTIVKQQNVAYNQQVNNRVGVLEDTPPKINFANKLISEAKHETLDIAGTLTTSPIDQSAETMVAVDGRENTTRKSN